MLGSFFADESDLIAYGRTLYRQEGCFMCHQLDGEGGTLGPDLTFQGSPGRTDDWLTGHFKDPPTYTEEFPHARLREPDRRATASPGGIPAKSERK